MIESRLQEVNKHTPFNLHYNKSVQAEINRYANTYRKHVSQMLGKAQFYFSLFEEILDRYDLPLEFKYLAIVESAKAHARSRSAATGLWQFMYNTGKIYDLKVTSYVDERSDPIQSTIACEYFTFLYKMFNDWELVLAFTTEALDMFQGPCEEQALKTIGQFGFLRVKLSVMFKVYCCKLHYEACRCTNIFPTPYPYLQAETDTINIRQSMQFETLSESLNIDIEVLKELNPMYKKA